MSDPPIPTTTLNVLVIDNYDSFTYNTVQLIARLNNNTPPYIVCNNTITFAEVQHLITHHGINCIVIGAGPGNPHQPDTLGVTADVLKYVHGVPILGICLGLQALVYIHSGYVIHNASGPMHGQLSHIVHNNKSPLYANVPTNFNTIRYNSLTPDINSIPSSLSVIAVAPDDNSVQAIQAADGSPVYAVQYHPESVCSEYGAEMMANFVRLANQHNAAHPRALLQCKDNCLVKLSSVPVPAPLRHSPHHRMPPVSRTLRLQHKRIACDADTQQVFTHLYTNTQSRQSPFWLDSSKHDGTARTRFSYIGDMSGEHALMLTYQLHYRTASIIQGNKCIKQWIPDDIFADLQSINDQYKHAVTADTTLPFDFTCGFSGYISYEMRQTTLPTSHIHQQTHREHSRAEHHNTICNEYPDALFVFADRLLIHDNLEHCWYAAALVDTQATSSNDAWLDNAEHMLTAAQMHKAVQINKSTDGAAVPCDWRFNSRQYKQLIKECKQQLVDGNSYELCLTNHVTAELDVDPLSLYINLRTINPAPYAAYFSIDLSVVPDCAVSKLSICSSSPERFVQVTRSTSGELICECKPIKGTIARGNSAHSDKAAIQQLQGSQKDYAENLMIVDLIRNDLAQVCELDSVQVTKLMCVETYATVHQLVSTVIGKLRAGNTAVDCVRKLFPPGSMTGAPKISSVDILHQYEQQPRGVYSGCIGYWSLNGTCDSSVVIRTVVCADSDISIGAGGAITHQSDVQAEYKEVLLKANAPLKALQMTMQAVYSTPQ